MHTHSHPDRGEREGTAAKSLGSDPQPSVYGKDLLLMHPHPLQMYYWELSMRAKPSLSARHCWEQDMAARVVCLLAATPACLVFAASLEQLQADAAEGTALMSRGGIHKRAMISDACLAPDPCTAVWEGLLRNQRVRAESPWQAKSSPADKWAKILWSRSPQPYQCCISLGLSLPSVPVLGLEHLRSCRRICGARGASQVYTAVLAQITLVVSKPTTIETVCRNCQRACKSEYIFLAVLMQDF